MVNPQKALLVLGLVCIFTILADCCSEREGCSRADRTRGRSARACLCGEAAGSGMPRLHGKSLKIAKGSDRVGGMQINYMVDSMIQNFIDKIKETTNGGKVRVPNFSTFYTSGSGMFAVSGEFHAGSGLFSDLTTIRRKSEATLRQEGRKVILTCAMSPAVATVQYEHCTVIYGYARRNGKMAVNLRPLTFAGTISADYSKKPCALALENLDVIQMGPIQAQVTNMGMLSSTINSAVNSYIQTTRGRIKRMVKIETAKMIAARLPEFDCEGYRATFNF